MSLTALTFWHRFKTGTLGKLVIEDVVYDDEGRHGPGPLTYTWNGPRPPHGGERLKWAIECQRIFADRFKASFDYATADKRGKPVVLRFMPGERPQKISFADVPTTDVTIAAHYNTQGEPYSG